MKIWRAAAYCLIVERQTQSEACERSRRLLTNHKTHSEQIMTGCLCTPTIDPCTSWVMPNVNRRCPRSKWKCNQVVTWHIYMCIPRKRKECLYCCVPRHALLFLSSHGIRRESLTCRETFVIWTTGTAEVRTSCERGRLTRKEEHLARTLFGEGATEVSR